MIAAGLLQAGAEVFISARKADTCEEAARELQKFGTVHAFARDLSQESECRALVEQVAEHTDAIDILVNNAGATWGAPLEEYPESGWDRVMDLNVKGLFNMTRFLRPMLEAAAGPDNPARVINISSIDATIVPLFSELRVLRVEGSGQPPHRAPCGGARSDDPGQRHRARSVPHEDDGGHMRDHGEQIRGMTRVGRLGRPEDIVGAVIYLASRAGNFVTGAVIPVDGGISTTGPAR